MRYMYEISICPVRSENSTAMFAFTAIARPAGTVDLRVWAGPGRRRGEWGGGALGPAHANLHAHPALIMFGPRGVRNRSPMVFPAERSFLSWRELEAHPVPPWFCPVTPSCRPSPLSPGAFQDVLLLPHQVTACIGYHLHVRHRLSASHDVLTSRQY